MGTIATVTPSTKRTPQRIGQTLEWEGTFAMSGSYATGGDTLPAKALGMTTIDRGIIAVDVNVYFKIVPQANGDAKILAKVITTGTEVANASNLAAFVPFAIIRGR